MIDRMLGGSGEGIANNRPMTEIEQRVIKAILKILVENLKESWRPISASNLKRFPWRPGLTWCRWSGRMKW